VRTPRFPFRIGVVETQIALALIILRQTEIQGRWIWHDQRAGSRSFRREARDDVAVLTTCQIGIDDLADKIGNYWLWSTTHYLSLDETHKNLDWCGFYSKT